MKLDTEKILDNVESMNAEKLAGHMTAAEAMACFKDSGIISGGGYDLYWKKGKESVEVVALVKSGESLDDYKL